MKYIKESDMPKERETEYPHVVDHEVEIANRAYNTYRQEALEKARELTVDGLAEILISDEVYYKLREWAVDQSSLKQVSIAILQKIEGGVDEQTI